jgi:murein DD-endopeptidase MepM/ murein hydrolase activator NlpD
MMRRLLIGVSLLLISSFAIYLNSLSGKENPVVFPGHPVSLKLPEIKEIVGVVRKGETLFDIFKGYDLDLKTVYSITRASKGVHNLFRLKPEHSYVITTLRLEGSERDEIESFKYSLDDSSYLKIVRLPDGYRAERVDVVFDRRLSLISGTIAENLISSLGNDREHILLAYKLADIFESDIDFVTELRKGDSFRMLVEELWLDGIFKGFGEIVMAEFVNNGKTYEAYRFTVDGNVGYFDEEGRSLKKALLRAPLRFRYISSGFSYRRKHPILKIYRPHMGVDYAAPEGTPVSAAGNGTVVYAGWRGAYGKSVIIRHPKGYKTYYGHLSRIKRGIKKGKRVSQGEVIGYVGSTGLATGPHLDYRVKRYDRFINPLKMRLPRTHSIPERATQRYIDYIAGLKSEMIERSRKTDWASLREGHS